MGDCPRAPRLSILDGTVGTQFKPGMTCPTGKHSDKPYGVDPVFLQTSRLYSVGTDIADYYDVDDPYYVDPRTTTPYAFHYDKDLDAFPVWLDAQLSATRAHDWVTMLEDGFFTNAQTDQLEIFVPTFTKVSLKQGAIGMPTKWTKCDFLSTLSITPTTTSTCTAICTQSPIT